jgi:putative molybdopterin biosynthesis protein
MIEGDKTTDSLTPIIGVPGYPVSAALTGEIFIEPVLARWLGQRPYEPPTIQATLTRKIASHTGDDDYVRVAVGQVGDKVMATPISRGAGVITSLVRADGIVRIPRFSEGEDMGTAVTVHLYRSPAEIARTILTIGSHDLTLDLLAQFLAERGDRRLASAHVGSLSGLVALRRGEAHLAGSHLLDEATGEYNASYVKRYLPDQDVVLVALVGREQGWIVPPGNLKGLSGWADAANPDVRIVNRQRGAGTRVLLDYELGKLDIPPEQVRGYDREEYTHLAVAAAVASGTADAGLGIRAAARALHLDFVPLAQERYELVIPRAHYKSELLRPLLDLLHDDEFKTAVATLPGYDVSIMGQVREIGD